MPGPTWLANVHAALDRAVFAAYGWSSDLADEEVLKNLLVLNLERSARATSRLVRPRVGAPTPWWLRIARNTPDGS
jgi:hypothetical protein